MSMRFISYFQAFPHQNFVRIIYLPSFSHVFRPKNRYSVTALKVPDAFVRR
jgi:hypothetical protein